jgi:glycosyltransferase involved in cell wall biosynthesis
LKKLLIYYSHFAPAYKAGGPIQSLVNMAEILRRHYRIYVVCGSYDLGESEVLRDIIVDQWYLYAENVSVFYSNRHLLRAMRQTMMEIDPDYVYINGLFLPVYNWYPLWMAINQKRKVVVAPRGMLQQGALTIKSTKKELFLRVFKFLGAHQRVRWHATDEQEKKDVQHVFGDKMDVRLAPNIPKSPRQTLSKRNKKIGELRLVFLSLITEKKNLLLLLETLQKVQTFVSLDIYGPIKDMDYWKKCQSFMKGSFHRINYKGSIDPNRVQDVLSAYHLFVLPTLGENFGHAIYEALSVGTPCIISRFTPWGMLQEKSSGITIELTTESMGNAIGQCLSWNEQDFQKESAGAYALALSYFKAHDYLAAYSTVFENSK